MQALLGVIYHSIGGIASGSFYMPYNKVKGWAWESFWMFGGLFSWLIVPPLLAWATVPGFFDIILAGSSQILFFTFLMGLLWGIGGLSYGLGVRYLGMSLGNSVVLGFCAAFGALVPPIYYLINPTVGKVSITDMMSSGGGQLVLIGVIVCVLGIAISGKAGMMKEKELSEEEKKKSVAEFSMAKGLIIAILSGILSSFFNFGIEAGKPLAEAAIQQGYNPLFQNNVAFVVILWGGLTTNFIWTTILSIKNKSYKDFTNRNTPISRNMMFCALAGTTWFMQFFFYGMGESKLGNGASSWILHMSTIILTANFWGIYRKEWKGVTKRTKTTIIVGIGVILSSVFLVGIGNSMPVKEEKSPWTHIPGQMDDQLKEAYILPLKITKLSDKDEALISNTDALLVNNKGQATGKNMQACLLKGSDKENAAILLDFGKELQGGLEIVTGIFDKKKTPKIRLTFGESISEALSKVENSSATNDHAMRDFILDLPWYGKIKVGNSGFRFAKIELLTKNLSLPINEIRAVSIMRDIPRLGSFKSNDERLNKIWETGAYTVHLNMQEYLWDGIKRDRLVWVGDMHPEVMTILSVFGYNPVVPKSLDFIKDLSSLPGWMNGISSYSLWWILIQHQWYMNTGDLEYIMSHKEYLYNLLKLLTSKIDENGKEILDGFRFLDWPNSPNTKAIHAGLQSLMIMSFECGAELAGAFGDSEKQSEYKKYAHKLKKHIPSPNGSKSGGALMALSGLCEAKAMNDSLLSRKPNQGISSFYGYYVLKARAEAGDILGSLDLIRNYWGGMLDLGASTFWEDFDLSWKKNATRIDEMPDENKSDVHADNGGYCYNGLRNSLCHGWASGPTAWLSEYVLGVKPLEPGCKTVLIKPNLGDLEWVEGSYPTPYGAIHLKYKKNKKGELISDIKAPKEIKIIKEL